MFRSRYDNYATTFSPEGRLIQVENAMKAVQQGMPTVAIRSDTYAVIGCIMHAPTKFSNYQQKIFKVDEHIGIAISGLTADGRGLNKFLREECLQHRFIFGTEAKAADLADLISCRSQKKTQKDGKRAYGVGLLMVGVSSDGPRLFETCPSGQHWEYNAQAIGRRAQAAKEYLEKHLNEFPKCGKEELIKHALKALDDCKKDDQASNHIAIGIVGIDEPFTILQGDELQQYK